MQNRQKLENEIELMSTLKMITQAYEEISVMRMQKIRNSVLQTREFLSKLNEVYKDVKLNYHERIVMLFQKKKHQDTSQSMLEKNGKTVSVLISTNSKMNGEIIQKVFRDFVAHVNKEETDIVIIGKVGRGLFEQIGIKKQFQYFELPEDTVDTARIKDLVLSLLPYKTVNVFYGKFDSLMFQNPVITNVTGNEGIAEEDAKTKDGKTKVPAFIFEPSVEKILQFFETQIFSSLVKQSVHESELARYASRIRAMEEAMQHVDKTNAQLYAQKRKLKQLINNKKQLEIMGRVSMITNT